MTVSKYRMSVITFTEQEKSETSWYPLYFASSDLELRFYYSQRSAMWFENFFLLCNREKVRRQFDISFSCVINNREVVNDNLCFLVTVKPYPISYWMAKKASVEF